MSQYGERNVQPARRWVLGAACVLGPVAVHVALAWCGPASRAGLAAISAASHASLYGALAWVFGNSLRPGREALVSRLARTVEPCVTPMLLRYTRAVTWVWAGFAVAQLATSLVLLATAPLAVWSAFVNLLDAPLVVTVFAAEYGFRRWRFRNARLASLMETVRAFARRPGVA